MEVRTQAGIDHGVITRHEMFAAGMSRAEVDRACRRGSLVRDQRGLYAVAGVPVTELRRARAAVQSVGLAAQAVASHDTAARLHGIDTVRRQRFEHVTIPRATRRPQRVPIRLHAHDLADNDVTVVDGIPTTTVARTLLDLLLRADRLTAIWASESALRAGLLSPNELGLILERGARRRGIKRARRRYQLIEPCSESPLETGVRLVFADFQLPPPKLQIPILGRDGSVLYRIDLGYEKQKVGVESDGRAVHEQPAALFGDRERQNAVLNAGWSLLRFTWSDYRNRYIAATTAKLIGIRL
ncbi:MAG: type IV toxin-antitoxin system AbiEi family antitoxin domain-containing protein [Geodermatophilaceae bacterium]|nr:type IV toxin-antitoxin system AbiEi family antitoxin domain-containing protein [Geodermatophilaceae bacterium]